jgi:hypothetical protein
MNISRRLRPASDRPNENDKTRRDKTKRASREQTHLQPPPITRLDGESPRMVEKNLSGLSGLLADA